MKVQNLIQNRFSGGLSNEAEYIELLVQVFAVLVLGLFLWRMMVVFQKRRTAKRKKSTYFESTFSKNWKK
ncbi:MAG: hypothetical protein WC994_07845 [Brumimicrobium sp.]